jgi:hypothetical protein
MQTETEIALRNFAWLVNNRDIREIHWDSRVIVIGDGGVDVDELVVPGFTPATER